MNNFLSEIEEADDLDDEIKSFGLFEGREPKDSEEDDNDNPSTAPKLPPEFTSAYLANLSRSPSTKDTVDEPSVTDTQASAADLKPEPSLPSDPAIPPQADLASPSNRSEDRSLDTKPGSTSVIEPAALIKPDQAPPDELPVVIDDAPWVEDIRQLAAKYRGGGLDQEDAKVLIAHHLRQRIVNQPIETAFLDVVDTVYATPPALPDVHQMDQIVLANYCAQRLQTSVAYCTEQGNFVLWNDHRWEFDQKRNQTMKRVRHLLEEMRMLIKSESKQTQYPQLLKTAGTTSTLTKDLELTLPEVKLTDFDADPFLLGVQNGMIELKNGTFREHRREDYHSKLANVEYDPHSTCPVFDSFIQQVMCGNEALMTCLQIIFGYLLIGINPERAFIFLKGDGRNGKSTLVNLIHRILGMYANAVPLKTLIQTQNPGVGDDLMSIWGYRMITCAELEGKDKLAVGVIKSMTGDRKSARHLYGLYQNIAIDGKLIISTNEMPIISDPTEGVWDRLKIIPFNYRVPEDKIDRTLDETLWSERSGILNWMLEGLKRYQQSGLIEAPEMLYEKMRCREKTDPVSDFMKRWYVKSATGKTKAVDILNHFNQWAIDNDITLRLTDTMLKARLTSMKYIALRSDTSYYNVTRINEDDESDSFDGWS